LNLQTTAVIIKCASMMCQKWTWGSSLTICLYCEWSFVALWNENCLSDRFVVLSCDKLRLRLQAHPMELSVWPLCRIILWQTSSPSTGPPNGIVCLTALSYYPVTNFVSVYRPTQWNCTYIIVMHIAEILLNINNTHLINQYYTQRILKKKKCNYVYIPLAF
jgi:hypothetical protein